MTTQRTGKWNTPLTRAPSATVAGCQPPWPGSPRTPPSGRRSTSAASSDAHRRARGISSAADRRRRRRVHRFGRRFEDDVGMVGGWSTVRLGMLADRQRRVINASPRWRGICQRRHPKRNRAREVDRRFAHTRLAFKAPPLMSSLSDCFEFPPRACIAEFWRWIVLIANSFGCIRGSSSINKRQTWKQDFLQCLYTRQVNCDRFQLADLMTESSNRSSKTVLSNWDQLLSETTDLCRRLMQGKSALSYSIDLSGS